MTCFALHCAWSPCRHSSQFLVRGDAGLSVRVQRSANLRDWEDWQALTLGATPSEFSDFDASTNSHRFYRAVTP